MHHHRRRHRGRAGQAGAAVAGLTVALAVAAGPAVIAAVGYVAGALVRRQPITAAGASTAARAGARVGLLLTGAAGAALVLWIILHSWTLTAGVALGVLTAAVLVAGRRR